ncbi:MAG: HPF/RaiA family ribosome-associated protein [Bacteroidia bacterium]|jgi:putative sigma-54 modulation protein|nr:HPF/RaiA family ribosome-associated protein [Bacteroidia bacterium]
MDIRIQSLKFDADTKLIDFTEKKLSKLPKYNEEIQNVEVTLSLLPDVDNKNVKIKIAIPGQSDQVVERNAHTFEDAVVDCVGVLKDLLVKVKEKKRDK